MSIHTINGQHVSIHVHGVRHDADRDTVEWFAVEWLRNHGVDFGDDHLTALELAARQGPLAEWHDPSAVDIEVSPA